MTEKGKNVSKTLGQAIDEIIEALESLEQESRITAIRATCEHLNICFTEKTRIESVGGEGPQLEIPPKPPGASDVRSFKKEKMPSSAIEMAAVVAFYLSELAPVQDRKGEVKMEDMVKYFKQADFPLPKTPEDILPNAKKGGYFDSAGRGRYKLNPVGYNLVAHNLPRTKSLIITKPGKSRRATRKSKQLNRAKNKK